MCNLLGPVKKIIAPAGCCLLVFFLYPDRYKNTVPALKKNAVSAYNMPATFMSIH